MLVVYWLISGVISVIQNAIGIAVGTAIGLPAPYALLSSAISMIGGHGAAASYGAQFTEMGLRSGDAGLRGGGNLRPHHGCHDRRSARQSSH